MKNIPPSQSPNPQGKGLIPVLQELESRTPHGHELATNSPENESLSDVLQDYAISRLILCAEFQFKPAVDTLYYLYAKDGRLRLSLIAPREWGDLRFGTYICECTLSTSMLWHIANKNELESISGILGPILKTLQHTLLADLFEDAPLDDTLPYFDAQLPFHRRVLANALASSLKRKLPGNLTKSFRQLANEHIDSRHQLPFMV